MHVTVDINLFLQKLCQLNPGESVPPWASMQNGEDYKRILLMMEKGEVDFSSFSVETLKGLFELSCNREQEFASIIEALKTAQKLLQSIKKLPTKGGDSSVQFF